MTTAFQSANLSELTSLPHRLLAFTLLELLVVIAIIALLSSMIFSLIGDAESVAMRTTTQSTMTKINTSIQQYQTDFRSFPHSEYTFAATASTVWDNRLAFRLMHKMSPQEFIDAKDLAQTKKDVAIASPSFNDPVDSNLVHAVVNYKGDDADWTTATQNWIRDTLYKHIAQRTYTFELNKNIQGAYLDTHDIGAENVSGESLLDAFGQPLIYVSFHEPATKAEHSWNVSREIKPVQLYAIQRITITDTDGNNIIDEIDGETTDIRSHGYPDYEGKYELWSAGADGLFDAIRGETVNADNVSGTAYKTLATGE